MLVHSLAEAIGGKHFFLYFHKKINFSGAIFAKKKRHFYNIAKKGEAEGLQNAMLANSKQQTNIYLKFEPTVQ